jgi:exodeoxyribonuclease VII large subunit
LIKVSTKTWLNVPFKEKDDAKLYGARWDRDERKWFAPANVDLTPLKKWCPPEVFVGAPEPEETGLESKGIRLSELLLNVKKAVENVTFGAVWVQAEIIEIKEYKWGASYELGELIDNEIRAQCRGKAWKQNQLQIQEQCSGVGIRLQKGIQALLLVRAKFDFLYGFQLDVLDIDPDFILGKLERKKKEIMAKLKAAGILGNNKKLPSPIDFEHVIVICPKGSAGQGDFRREADDLESRGLCSFTYFTATFQGANSSSSLQKAMQKANELCNKKPTQAIVIIRGGGATTDLSWLDDLELAKLICLSSKPVFTGLGHEKDRSVLDEVSNHSFDTPSKVSLHIRSCILSQGGMAIEALNGIKTMVQYHLEVSSSRAAECHTQIGLQSRNLANTYGERILKYVSRIHLEGRSLVRLCRSNQQSNWQSTTEAVGILDRIRTSLQQQLNDIHKQTVHLPVKATLELNAQLEVIRMLYKLKIDQAETLLKHISFRDESKVLLKNARLQSQHLMSTVLARDPKSILDQGFSIARSQKGIVVTTAKIALQSAQLTFEFQDGTIQVQNPQPYEKGVSND